jgi:rfaE bifunctional protein nucleotidyltransferase chain/domain/rfaE bifunctional protein kinase chain/domain
VAEHVVVIGDALLDRDVDGHAERLAPDAPVPVVHDAVTTARPGGAALAARLVARLDARVTLVTAFGCDDAGHELAELVAADGVEVVDLGRSATPVKTRVRVDGHALVRVDEGEDDDEVLWCDALRRDPPADVDAVLSADYGRGVVDHPAVRDWLDETARRVPVVWDPHPRGGVPVPGARLVTPNRSEVRGLGFRTRTMADVARAADVLARRWRAQGVAVTLAHDGAVLGVPGRLPLAVPAPVVTRLDPCGAGDCFAAAATVAAARGQVLTEAVSDAVAAASRFVAAGGVRSPGARPPDASASRDVQQRHRLGTVVATSGCFDLVHAGHVAMLEAARALGDSLVVLLNSDSSVRDLKGAERPIVGQEDRAAVLRGLECVDDVVVFDERTPVRALERLRPQLFVKGDDYGAGDIPETAVMRRWGGAVVVVPYLQGRSTTRLIEEVHREQ